MVPYLPKTTVLGSLCYVGNPLTVCQFGASKHQVSSEGLQLFFSMLA